MWVVILVGVLLILQVLRGVSETSKEVPFSDFLDQVAAGEVDRVLIKGEEIHIRTSKAEEGPVGAPRHLRGRGRGRTRPRRSSRRSSSSSRTQEVPAPRRQDPQGRAADGPPGTGKTLLARAVAGEAGVPFFSISGSDFVEMFVGVGASRVRDLFEQGKKNAPCIIFIDEIDAVGRHRGAGLGGGHDEREQTLNQMLVEMDGFEANEGVIIMAATNRPDVLDPALLRPGRFDRQIVVPCPTSRAAEAILKVHTARSRWLPDVDLESIARPRPASRAPTSRTSSTRRPWAMLRVLMGGRLAEEIVFGSDSMTTGAGNDLERATDLARKMVCEWGMSEEMGPLTFGKKEESIFLGKEMARHQDFSEATSVKIDDEVRRFVNAAYADAKEILVEHRASLDAISMALLEREVLDGEEIIDLIAEHSGLDPRSLRKRPEFEPPEEVHPSE
jgi:ATP-dependent Zn protease